MQHYWNGFVGLIVTVLFISGACGKKLQTARVVLADNTSITPTPNLNSEIVVPTPSPSPSIDLSQMPNAGGGGGGLHDLFVQEGSHPDGGYVHNIFAIDGNHEIVQFQSINGTLSVPHTISAKFGPQKLASMKGSGFGGNTNLFATTFEGEVLQYQWTPQRWGMGSLSQPLGAPKSGRVKEVYVGAEYTQVVTECVATNCPGPYQYFIHIYRDNRWRLSPVGVGG